MCTFYSHVGNEKICSIFRQIARDILTETSPLKQGYRNANRPLISDRVYVNVLIGKTKPHAQDFDPIL